MKRFYRSVGIEEAEDGFIVTLDGRVLPSPDRNRLALPTRALAEAVSGEWEAQGDEIRPATMPMMRLASTAADRVAPRVADVRAELARFAEVDLVCYRADAPTELVRRQEAAWQPLLDWLVERHHIRLAVTTGICPVEQPEAALARIRNLLVEVDSLTLTGVYAAATAANSVAIALALHAGRVEPEEAIGAAEVDERFQMEAWGEDVEALRRLESRRIEIRDAARLFALVR